MEDIEYSYTCYMYDNYYRKPFNAETYEEYLAEKEDEREEYYE